MSCFDITSNCTGSQNLYMASLITDAKMVVGVISRLTLYFSLPPYGETFSKLKMRPNFEDIKFIYT